MDRTVERLYKEDPTVLLQKYNQTKCTLLHRAASLDRRENILLILLKSENFLWLKYSYILQ